MYFRQIADSCLAQYAYLIGCRATGEAILIDPERDVDRYLAIADEQNLRIVAAAETHIHADFLSGVREIAERIGVKVYVSREGDAVGWGSTWAKDARYDVAFLCDGDVFKIGNITFKAVRTPGHTPEHLSFLVTDFNGKQPIGLLSGDFLFAGDLGRPDLLETAAHVTGTMEESAQQLHASAIDALGLPDHLQIWPGHGAGSACGKSLGAIPQTTAGYEKLQNPALSRARTGRAAFVEYILADQPEPPL